eukprot:SAG22_NODE_14960_length_360_cov_1.340996_1_plen_32_part_10
MPNACLDIHAADVASHLVGSCMDGDPAKMMSM